MVQLDVVPKDDGRFLLDDPNFDRDVLGGFLVFVLIGFLLFGVIL